MHAIKVSAVVGLFGLVTMCVACQPKPLIITAMAPTSEGAPYSLRFTQFETKIKWRIVACGQRSPKPRERWQDLPTQPFTVRAEVGSEPSFPEDPKYRWSLDLASLDGWFNTTDLSVTYEGGKFKSLSASVEDKTVDTVKAVAATAAQIIAIGAAVGGSPDGDECANIVEAVDAATKDVKAATIQLESAKQDLADANARGMGARHIARYQGRLDKATFTLASKAATLEKAIKVATFEQTIRWPVTGGGSPTKDVPLPVDAIDQWQGKKWKDEATKIKVVLELHVIGADGTYAAVAKPSGEQPLDKVMNDKIAQGRVPVRLARQGALVAYFSAPTLDGKEVRKEISRKEATIVQSGEMVYIPVFYRWPRSSTNGFGLDATGNLASISHKQSSAPGLALAQSGQAIAEQAKPLFKSDLDRLKAENEDLQAQKTNIELKGALAPKAPDAYKQELDAVNSELALKKAKLELMLVDRWTSAISSAN